MKINIPGSSEENKKSEPVKFEGKKSKKVKEGPIEWRESGEFITAIIYRKLIKIEISTFDIHLPNGFKMSNNKSLDESKEKAISFFSEP